MDPRTNSRTSLQEIEGIVQGHRDGHGFVIRDDGDSDIYIPANEMRAVLHKDTYLDEDLKEHDEWVEGYPARVMQHEFDHLDGKMFIDHLSTLRKQMIKGKLGAMLKGKARCSYKVKTLK